MGDLSWTIEHVAGLVGGHIEGDPRTFVKGVYIDSREEGDRRLFVALAGDRFDGHDFAVSAEQVGAAAVMMSKAVEGLGVPRIIVEDTLSALQELGRARRRSFPGPVAAVTGSSGKTTTRHLLAGLLRERFVTHEPKKNFNNHVGLPLTLLETSADSEAMVLELGCSDFGEIAALTEIADPDVALVTNVGPAHLERLGDLDGVARAKGEIFAGMRADTTAVVNADDPRVALMPLRSGRKVTYGADPTADVVLQARASLGLEGQSIRVCFSGEKVEMRLPLIGEHNALNAVAAAAAAWAMGVTPEEIRAGMEKARPYSGRLEAKTGPGGSVIVDDTYNANPSSMAAALKAIRETAAGGRIFLMLADMLELGDSTEKAHGDLGRAAAEVSPELLITLGEGGRMIGLAAVEAGLEKDRWRNVDTHEEAAGSFGEKLGKGDALLVKGSRGKRLEKVVELLTEGGG